MRKAESRRVPLPGNATMRGSRLESNFVDMNSLPDLKTINKARSLHVSRPEGKHFAAQRHIQEEVDAEELKEEGNQDACYEEAGYLNASDTHEALPSGAALQVALERQRTLQRQGGSAASSTGYPQGTAPDARTQQRIEPFIPAQTAAPGHYYE